MLKLKKHVHHLSVYLIILCYYSFSQALLLGSKSRGEEGKHSRQHFILCFKRRKRLVRIAKDLLCCVADKIHSLILLWRWRSPLIVNALIIVMGVIVVMVTSMVLVLLELSLIVTVADL